MLSTYDDADTVTLNMPPKRPYIHGIYLVREVVKKEQRYP